MRGIWISMALAAALVCVAPCVESQDATLVQLQQEYDSLETQIRATNDPAQLAILNAEIAPIEHQLTAMDEAAFAANTQAFEAVGQQIVNVDAELLKESQRLERRYRREPWHREFWRR